MEQMKGIANDIGEHFNSIALVPMSQDGSILLFLKLLEG